MTLMIKDFIHYVKQKWQVQYVRVFLWRVAITGLYVQKHSEKGINKLHFEITANFVISVVVLKFCNFALAVML